MSERIEIKRQSTSVTSFTPLPQALVSPDTSTPSNFNFSPQPSGVASDNESLKIPFPGHDFSKISISAPGDCITKPTIQRKCAARDKDTLLMREVNDTGDASINPLDTSSNTAVPLGGGNASSGSTTVQDPKLQHTTHSGKTLEDVANNLPDEAGSVTFSFSTSTQGDPATKATLTVTQIMTMPRWAERDKQCPPVKKAWDSFYSALKNHEDGHVAINKQEFANAHQRFIGKTSGEMDQESKALEAYVQGKNNDYDTKTDHGRKQTPPTEIDTGVECEDSKKQSAETGFLDTIQDTIASVFLMRSSAPEPFVPSMLPLHLARQVRSTELNNPLNFIPSEPAHVSALQTFRMATPPRAVGEHNNGVVCQADRISMQRSSQTPGSAQAENIGQQIQSAMGRGGGLDQGIQQHLEHQLGTDLSGVKVHTDSEADRLSKSVNAIAFATGQDIFFSSGSYNPTSTEGQHLIAHEVVHTVQQANGAVAGTSTAGGISISDPSDPFEQEADRVADQVMRMPNPTGSVGRSLSGAVQHKCADGKQEDEAVMRKARTTTFIQRDKTSDQLKDLETRTQVLEKKTAANQLDLKYRALFGEKISTYKQVVYRLTAAFQTAMSGYQGALNKQASQDAVIDQIITTLILVAGTAALEPFLSFSLGKLQSALGKTSQKIAAVDIKGVVEKLENPINSAASGAGNTVTTARAGDRAANSQAAGLPAGEGRGSGGGDPLSFLASNLEAIEMHNQKFEAAFSSRATQYDSLVSDDWNRWSKDKQESDYSALLKNLDSVALGDIAKLDGSETLAVKIELYLWAAWIKTHQPGVKGLQIGSQVAKRLKSLGLESLANVKLDTDSWIFMEHDVLFKDEQTNKSWEDNLHAWANGWSAPLLK
ncbi:DUF4157 domain-containing protein [Oculatella sp. LEGE 06141]|uniref:eCIS core domain-containing protein n=1 Tax=Oculatella sp. LEGE 06141 TaxID=1828648 RepID=UPI00187FE0ED|nr:DUF4157 domain-containing protein [Oculatella sp. LEGE 06141]MBE9182077.1 DUF4157 domain-containing protein [Oculatella sp. LEGE 06141]